MKKRVLIGVTGGIAAIKIPELARQLKNGGLDVDLVLTKSATHFFSKSDLRNFRINTDLFPKNYDVNETLRQRKVKHISLADSSDLMVIVPATANVIAKLVNGIADDLLTTTAVAISKPIIVFPSMNPNMYHNQIVKKNISTLKSYGFIVIEPVEGKLACGYDGKGRLTNVQEIKKIILDQIAIGESLKGKRILVTSGATQEKIDDVRFISNNSSGKMGTALANECKSRGADVLLLRSKNSSQSNVKEQIFETIEDLESLLGSNLKNFDILFHCAAIGDFKVEYPKAGKLESAKAATLKLVPQKKLINLIKKINPKIKLIAFKAHFGMRQIELEKSVNLMMHLSGADTVITNDVSNPQISFGSDFNQVTIFLKNGTSKKIGLSPKTEVAKQIIEFTLKDRHLLR